MKKILAIGALAAMMCSCSPYALVNSVTYNDANLNEVHTFRIVTPDEGKLPPGMEMVTYDNRAAAILEQMVERGFTEDPSSPILVNIGLTVKKELATEPLLPPPAVPHDPYGAWHYPPVHGMYPYFMYHLAMYWPPYNPNAQVVVGVYREGVLTMDIVNMAKHLPLYTSSVATILDNGDTQFRDLQGIAQAVKVLFSKFPVPLLPQYKQ